MRDSLANQRDLPVADEQLSRSGAAVPRLGFHTSSSEADEQEEIRSQAGAHLSVSREHITNYQ